MTIEELERVYFDWLESNVSYEYRKHNSRSFRELLVMLHEKEFVWTVPNDDNRLEDGKELRYLFLHDDNGDRLPQYVDISEYDMTDFRSRPCSLLEVMVGLGRRLAFQAEGTCGWWVWRLIVNLELHKMKDPLTLRKKQQIEEIMDAVIWRTYKWDGVGGFFPLAFPDGDQRKVEVWYQMHAYLAENFAP